VAELLAAASDNRVTLRTTARAEAMTALANAGAEVAATGPDVLTIAGLSSERIVAILTQNTIPFAEVSAHRASLEEAYMELTRDSVEYSARQGGDPRTPDSRAAPGSAGRHSSAGFADRGGAS
jgi:ABC-2 type transport system ATP-binding protein